jgi:hypothetical protein
MVGPKKSYTSEVLCAKVNKIQSVLELTHFVIDTPLPILGVEFEADIWQSLKLKDVLVLETIVVRLRKLIEARKFIPHYLDDSSEEQDDEDTEISPEEVLDEDDEDA